MAQQLRSQRRRDRQANPPGESHQRHVASTQPRRREIGGERHERRRMEAFAEANGNPCRQYRQKRRIGAAPAAIMSRQALVNRAAASAIITTRRRPSPSLAIGAWATTTVAVLASRSDPITWVL